MPGLDEKAKVVIIGTSFIGMELAGAIVKKKPASIDVIGVDAVPFAKILGEKIGAAVQKVGRTGVESRKRLTRLSSGPGIARRQVPHGGQHRKAGSFWLVSLVIHSILYSTILFSNRIRLEQSRLSHPQGC
jgi:hypothetical protein